MVRFIACFFACIAFIAPGFAADGAVRRVVPTASDTGSVPRTNATNARTAVVSRTADTNATTSDNSVNTTTNSARTSRVVAATGGANANARTDTTAGRTVTASRASISRAAGATNSNTRGGLDSAVHTVGRNARVMAASVNSDPSVRRAGVSLRPSTAEVGGRATIAGTDVQTGSNVGNNVRGVSSRAATATVATRESIANAREVLEQTAELNKSCQEQYNDCMDQFCAVIDANQKRCSCSANLSQYAKVEAAVKDANTQLNDVAQRIRYVGLSADEIRAILTATEAEEALSGQRDISETRAMLADIEDLIIDPTQTSSSTTASDGLGILDIDTDFSSGADMFSLDLFGGNSSSFSNRRGKQLFEAAKKRCSIVLSKCTDAGATSQQITGNYELAIDKDCIAYEQGLKKMNDTLLSNVRSAGQMLEKARLTVHKNQNEYDAKGCVAALESCMTDDMVCGSDYRKCLDPTKKYMDENGDVVLGQNISEITQSMEGYNNAITSENLSTAYGQSIGNCAGGTCHLTYLLRKIGTKQKVTDEGLCRAVLDKCRAYTYDANGVYLPYNDVVVNYMQRAMVNISAAQRRIISDYASSCMVDVSACYNQQVSQVNSWSSSASVNSIYNVMRGACRNVALTCAYAVFYNPDAKNENGENTNDSCSDPDTCIENISKMFYQSMLCPDNSVYDNTWGTVSGTTYSIANGTSQGWVNTQCKCNTGYYVWGGKCMPDCGDDQCISSSGVCVDMGSTYSRDDDKKCHVSNGGGGGSGSNGSGRGDTKLDLSTCPLNAHWVSDGDSVVPIAGSGHCECDDGYQNTGTMLNMLCT